MRHLRQPHLLFILLAVAVAMGLTGSSLSPLSVSTVRNDAAQMAPTVATTESVVQSTETSQPTAEPTSAATEEPSAPLDPTTPVESATEGAAETPAPTATQRPAVAENTTGSSVLFQRGTASEPQVALTFDAGEGPGYTAEILDFLGQHNIKASFGITGEWAREYPDLVQRMVDEGHMVFNHSESHQSWTGVSTSGVALTEDERIDELMGAAAAIEEVADYETAPFWRPPYGDYDAEGQALLAEYGYGYTLMWTCDSLAWSGTTAEEIVERCGPGAEGGGPGAIILMHVTQEADYRSLEGLVAAYEAEGYRFVTMEEMIAVSE